MPRPPRNEVFQANEICIVHAILRCVRRVYLTGIDDLTGKDYEYRGEWIRAQIEKLASVFAIDVLSYAILANRLHVVIRNRPDVVKTWSNHEVALRWLQIFPGKRIDERLGDPTTSDVDSLAKDSERLAEIRERLSDISWFMRTLSEPIARWANCDEQCTGTFWEGRYKAQRIIDEAALLACCMYVDLNPIRAAMAESLSGSKFTSAYDRMEADRGKTIESSAASMKTISREEAAKIYRESTPKQLAERRKAATKRKGARVARDAWLAPMKINPRAQGALPSKSGLRASDKGFLDVSWEDYRKLLEWTSRQGRPDKSGKIRDDHTTHIKEPDNHGPLLERLGIASGMWCDLVWGYEKYFGRSRGAGSADHLREDAAANSLSFHPGQKQVRKCFANP